MKGRFVEFSVNVRVGVKKDFEDIGFEDEEKIRERLVRLMKNMGYEIEIGDGDMVYGVSGIEGKFRRENDAE